MSLSGCLASSWSSRKGVLHDESKESSFCASQWMSALLCSSNPAPPPSLCVSVSLSANLMVRREDPSGVAELQSGSRSSRTSLPIPPEGGRAGCCTSELLSRDRAAWQELWGGDGLGSSAKNDHGDKPTLMTAENPM